jgi:hypothetical protein
MKRLREITMNLIIAWGLSAVCGLSHALHMLGASAPAWLKAINTLPVHAGLSAAALLGTCDVEFNCSSAAAAAA